MDTTRPLDLSSLLDNSQADLVLASVESLFSLSWTREAFAPVHRVFDLTRDLYEGRLSGYASCRTGYHDWRHVLDVFIASARLMDGCVLGGHALTCASAVDVLVSSLLHDAGYVQEAGDCEGTGAKYTKTHVIRSAEFAKREASRLGLSDSDAERVARLIMGTDLALKWEELPFRDGEERYCAAILAAADLLGQMADRAYLEKLLFLYYEFKEAGISGYDSADDILRRTSSFYASIKQRLDVTLGEVSYAAQLHFVVRQGVEVDLYRTSIERQMDYLVAIMDEDAKGFRKRLRRLDVPALETSERDRLSSFGLSLS